MKKWSSDPPKQCDICKGGIFNVFIDGKVMRGGWAIMCPICHRVLGNGLGTGRGQAYKKVGKEFVKVAG